MTKQFVDRPGDMHPTRALRVRKQSDGDIIVCIIQEGWPMGDPGGGDEKKYASIVEFCQSGQRSPRTMAALRVLFEAIELDNAEHPIPSR